jgi:hypothetical protein
MDVPILRFVRYTSPGPQFLTSGPHVALEIMRGRVQQRYRPVQGRVFLIGTARDCDLVLGDETFPEAYAYVLLQEDRVLIRRLGLGPDLYVGAEQVETAELWDGDQVAFGPFELRAIIPGQSASASGSQTDESLGSHNDLDGEKALGLANGIYRQ